MCQPLMGRVGCQRRCSQRTGYATLTTADNARQVQTG